MSGVQVLLFTDLGHSHVWSRPSGAYRIATELRKNGYTVQVIDCISFFTPVQLLSLIGKFVGKDTVAIGFSTTFFAGLINIRNFTSDSDPWMFPISRSDSKVVMEYIRHLSPKVKIIAGGAKAAELPKEIGIDYVISGYAEKMMLDLMGYLTKKNYNNPMLVSKKLPNGSYLLDYDTKGEQFDFKSSTIRWAKEDCLFPGESVPIEISRGCIFKCKFCNFPLNGKTKNDFIKNQDSLVEELNRNYEEFGIYNYIYADDTHNDSTDKLVYLNQLLPQLKKKPLFTTYLRLDLIHAHREQADLLKENGLVSAMFGIETLNHSAGKTIGKGLSPEKNIETLHWLKERWGNSIKTTSGFIIGLPGETKQSVDYLFDWLNSSDRPLDGFELKPLFIKDPARADSRLWKSEFDTDPTRFGYSFDPDDSPFHWKYNGYIDSFQTANKLVNGFRNSYRKNDLHSFLVNMIANYKEFEPAFDIANLQTMSNQEFDKLMQRTNPFKLKIKMVNLYYQNLMAL